MYFNDKNYTNIDDEFNNKKNINILEQLKKHKKLILIITAIIIIVTIFIIFMKKESTYLELEGESIITLYQGNEYIEPGYNAYINEDYELNNHVTIESNLNINKIGDYEITYSIDGIVKKRKIIIIEKPKEYTYIYLNSVNNSTNIYLQVGETYVEPGYQVFNSKGLELTNNVKITGNVDTSKAGNYKLTYSVEDSNNVVITTTRTVIVMSSEIHLSVNPEVYTKNNVTIDVGIMNNYFDYMILPDGTKTDKTKYSYKVDKNGKYTFTIYNKKGVSKKSTIEVKNIDRTVPNASCSGYYQNGKSIVNVKATDSSGINKYVINNISYNQSTITLNKEQKSVNVTVYDKAGNTKSISCKLQEKTSSSTNNPNTQNPNTQTKKIYISNISNDGVIVKIKAVKVNTNISGYYFSYTSKRPDKTTGGYLSTSKDSIEVVRLPGTTYVWVEDTSGNISEAKKITLTNSVLYTTVDKHKILEGTTLSTFLSNKGWSISELDKLIARSVRAAGLYTKEASATSSVALITVLAQKYGIKIPYWWGGKSWDFGSSENWGKNRESSYKNTKYYYYGLDCAGLTVWAYVNAGYKIPTNTYPYYDGMKSIKVTKENGEVGDFLNSDDHIKLIIGKTSEGFITAEAKGKVYGTVISIHPYNYGRGYSIIKGETYIEKYKNYKYDRNKYPSGF